MRPLLPTIAHVTILFLTLTAMAATNDTSIHTQPPIIRSWGTEAGLPQNSVNAVVQTLDGYLWLGTQDGLVRFDGERFKTLAKNVQVAG